MSDERGRRGPDPATARLLAGIGAVLLLVAAGVTAIVGNDGPAAGSPAEPQSFADPGAAATAPVPVAPETAGPGGTPINQGGVRLGADGLLWFQELGEVAPISIPVAPEDRPAVATALAEPVEGASFAAALGAAVRRSGERAAAAPIGVRLVATVDDPGAGTVVGVAVRDDWGWIAAAAGQDGQAEVIGVAGRTLRGEPGPEPPALAALLIRGADVASTSLVVLGGPGVERVEVLAGTRRIARPGRTAVLPGTDLAETGANGQPRIAAVVLVGYGADGSVIPAYAAP